MMSPKEWAEKTSRHLGVENAIRICETTGRKLIGNSNDEPNPHYGFFLAALIWLRRQGV
jgi:hypothetical protein